MAKLTLDRQSGSTITSAWLTVFKVIGAIGKPAKRDQQIQNAYAVFAAKHPEWVKCYFDQSFVDHQLTQLIILYQRYDRLPTAMDIALLWDEYYGTGSLEERKARLERLAPVVESFLKALNTESNGKW